MQNNIRKKKIASASCYTYATAGGGLVAAWRSTTAAMARTKRHRSDDYDNGGCGRSDDRYIRRRRRRRSTLATRTPPPRTARSAAAIRRVHCRAPSSSVNHRRHTRPARPSARSQTRRSFGGGRAGSRDSGKAAFRSPFLRGNNNIMQCATV
jgi:hypothetical protein